MQQQHTPNAHQPFRSNSFYSTSLSCKCWACNKGKFARGTFVKSATTTDRSSGDAQVVACRNHREQIYEILTASTWINEESEANNLDDNNNNNEEREMWSWDGTCNVPKFTTASMKSSLSSSTSSSSSGKLRQSQCDDGSNFFMRSKPEISFGCFFPTKQRERSPLLQEAKHLSVPYEPPPPQLNNGGRRRLWQERPTTVTVLARQSTLTASDLLTGRHVHHAQNGNHHRRARHHHVKPLSKEKRSTFDRNGGFVKLLASANFCFVALWLCRVFNFIRSCVRSSDLGVLDGSNNLQTPLFGALPTDISAVVIGLLPTGTK